MDANPDHTTWAAHTHTDYDSTGRVVGVSSWDGHGDTDNHQILDLDYCYTAGTTAPTCTATTAGDRSKLQWVKDTLTGAVTAYTYDQAGRLTQAKITGGTTPAQTLTVNVANQITSAGYLYDGAGNLTADPDGQYTYNGPGR